MKSIAQRIAEELKTQDWQVASAIALLDEGATVPFIARYRKEATGTLDDAQLRTLEERMRYLREMDERRAVILASIQEQGKLDDSLRAAIEDADTKAQLEDLYLPYRPKRRSKAQAAREAGLEPLADLLLSDAGQDPETAAGAFIDPERGVADSTAALEGARAILVERFSEDAQLVGTLREEVWERGQVVSQVRAGKETAGAKFADYFDYSEKLTRLPSHRILALFRGEKEEALSLSMRTDDSVATDPAAPSDGTLGAVSSADAGSVAPAEPVPAQSTSGRDDSLNPFEQRIARHFVIVDLGRPADRWLRDSVRWAWRTRLMPHIEADLRMRLWQAAEEEAVRIFAGNLRDLLLAAPAGPRATMGLDPGFRTGVKVAVIDVTGRVSATATIYPHEPQKRWDEAIASLAALAQEHRVELIAIGNGTASRETDRLAGDLMQRHPELGLTKVVVSEAGASVYSASAYASRELSALDVSLRGAVSIARRLQDPLAELVKIDPRAIGVGQYQHDLSESKLSRSLDAVVEDCVNAVGVDVNTASAPLLARVSGIGESLAENIVHHRESNGRFSTRAALKEVPRLGPKAFELCAGFLRIPDGDDPLDGSAVHPEAYPVVHRILAATHSQIRELIGNAPVLRGLQPDVFTCENFGVPTVSDILRELEKPGRDPRPEFRTARFRDDVVKIEDLQPGMVLEGVVSNVVAFGAFVDVGVHQDGLVHISALADRFVSDPRAVVKPGDVVKVRVVEVDVARKRIALSMRSEDAPPVRRGERSDRSPDRTRQARDRGASKPAQKRFPASNAAAAAAPENGGAQHASAAKSARAARPRSEGAHSEGARKTRPASAGRPASEPAGNAMAEALRRAGLARPAAPDDNDGDRRRR